MNTFRTRIFAQFLAIAIPLLLGPVFTCHAQSLNGVFDDAIDASQKKMVKVFGAGAGRVESYATGLVISDDGKIITRQGVFLEGNQVRVTMFDGKTYEASVLKRNRQLQTALIKIPAKTPHYFKLHEKPVGKKGDWVVAISNAFKVADKKEPLSTTLGVISLRSTIDAKINKRDVAYKGPIILIDCITSNPGAAGGAVIDEKGNLVGMIGTIIKSSDTNTRLNYAVPGETLKTFAENNPSSAVADTDPKIKKKSELGIRLFKLGGRRSPAYVDKVIPNSPAAEIGMRSDDLIISLDGNKINNSQDFQEALDDIEPGREIIIIYKRRDELIRVPIKPVEKK